MTVSDGGCMEKLKQFMIYYSATKVFLKSFFLLNSTYPDFISVTSENYFCDFKTEFITTAQYLALAASLKVETQYLQNVTF